MPETTTRNAAPDGVIDLSAIKTADGVPLSRLVAPVFTFNPYHIDADPVEHSRLNIVIDNTQYRDGPRRLVVYVTINDQTHTPKDGVIADLYQNRRLALISIAERIEAKAAALRAEGDAIAAGQETQEAKP